jgi:hypothetical protein
MGYRRKTNLGLALRVSLFYGTPNFRSLALPEFNIVTAEHTWPVEEQKIDVLDVQLFETRVNVPRRALSIRSKV